MNLLKRIIRFLFLVKEIISKDGVLHFQRYRLIQTPWFALYIHGIFMSDLDKHFHDHPWEFWSFILFGIYEEKWSYAPDHYDIRYAIYSPGMVNHHVAEDAHQLILWTPSVWTLVFVKGRERVWGYQTKEGWIDFQTYRRRKNEGNLPL